MKRSCFNTGNAHKFHKSKLKSNFVVVWKIKKKNLNETN